jgi:DNA adenine methylase
MAPGAGLIKTGEAGKGLSSRWYPTTLRKRILDIVKIRQRITFIHGDGIAILRQHAEGADAVFFIDPPYTASEKRAGSRLYTHPDVNHQGLFNVAATLKGDFLMTYDDAEEVRALARLHGFDMQTVAMKNTHHAKMNELLIGRNLDWLR